MTKIIVSYYTLWITFDSVEEFLTWKWKNPQDAAGIKAVYEAKPLV